MMVVMMVMVTMVMMMRLALYAWPNSNSSQQPFKDVGLCRSGKLRFQTGK